MHDKPGSYRACAENWQKFHPLPGSDAFSRAIAELAEVMEKLANSDVMVAVPVLASKDELGPFPLEMS